MQTLGAWQQSQPQACDPFLAAVGCGRLHHAYVLVDRKRTVSQRLARAMAQALLCKGGAGLLDRPCGVCTPCRKVQGANHPDFFALLPNDKGVLPIDSVRDLLPSLYLRPAEADRKVVIVEGADGMTTAAQNAFLKTLEEPPGAAHFFLTTARPKALLPTIRSRVVQLVLPSASTAGARAGLEATGMSARVAALLAPIVGDDVERAQVLVTDVEALVEPLQNVLGGRLSPSELLRLAEDLGGDADRSTLALALLEVVLRDALAARHQASAQVLYGETMVVPRAVAAVGRLQAMRRLAVYNPNRTMALEGLFFELAGCLS